MACCQFGAMIKTNAGLLSSGTLWRNFCENTVCEVAAILTKGRWINSLCIHLERGLYTTCGSLVIPPVSTFWYFGVQGFWHFQERVTMRITTAAEYITSKVCPRLIFLCVVRAWKPILIHHTDVHIRMVLHVVSFCVVVHNTPCIIGTTVIIGYSQTDSRLTLALLGTRDWTL